MNAQTPTVRDWLVGTSQLLVGFVCFCLGLATIVTGCGLVVSLTVNLFLLGWHWAGRLFA